MMKIEVIGLEPPCKKCNELLENARNAVEELGRNWALRLK
jgi:hypothetical protein